MKLITARPELAALGRRAGMNTLWLFLGRVGTQGLMVLFTILIARRLGEVGLGEYTFVISVVFLANVATTFGTDMYLVRHIAARSYPAFVPEALALQVGLSLPALGVILLLPASTLNLSADGVAALRLYGLSLIPMAFYNVSSAALRGVERMDALVALNLATVAMQVLAVWLLIRPGRGIVLLAGLLLAVQVGSGLLAAALCLSHIPSLRRARSVSIRAVRQVARASAPIAVLSVLGIVYQRAVIYLLMTMSGPAATGWFSAAARMIEIPKFGHVAVMGALLPVMAQAQARPEGAEPFDHLFGLSFAGLIAFSALAAGLLFLLAAPLTALFYGEGFAPTVPVLKVMAWSLIPFTVTNYLSLRIFAAGHEKGMVLPLAGGILVLLATSLLTIPRRGAAGAAGAVLVAECLLALAYALLWRRLAPAVKPGR